jgi:hypothetical protein
MSEHEGESPEINEGDMDGQMSPGQVMEGEDGAFEGQMDGGA